MKKNTNTVSIENRKYTMSVMFDPRSAKMIESTIEDNKIPYTLKSNYYVIIHNIDFKTVEKYKELFRKCSTTSSDGTRLYRVRFGTWKYKEVVTTTTEKKPKSHTNNTPETALEAKKARKAKKALPRHQKSEYAAKRNELKKDSEAAAQEGRVPVVGRNARRLVFRAARHGFKSTDKVCPGIKENNLQKKLRKRVEKACQYLAKQEKKEAVKMAVKPVKKGNKKPTQLELPLAA